MKKLLCALALVLCVGCVRVEQEGTVILLDARSLTMKATSGDITYVRFTENSPDFTQIIKPGQRVKIIFEQDNGGYNRLISLKVLDAESQ